MVMGNLLRIMEYWENIPIWTVKIAKQWQHRTRFNQVDWKGNTVQLVMGNLLRIMENCEDNPIWTVKIA